MTHLKDFTISMERASKSDPMMQRWLYGTRKLEQQLSERLVHFCQYLCMIPEEAMESYTDVLLEALENVEEEDTISASSENVMESLIALVEILEKSKDSQKKEKGSRIREKIGK